MPTDETGGSLSSPHDDTLHAHLLVIGLADFDHLSRAAQSANLDVLRQAVSRSTTCDYAQRQGHLRVLPDAEGLTLICTEDLTVPLRCAEEIGEILVNQALIRARIGIHTGPIPKDVPEESEPAAVGETLLQTRRIMQQGEAGHILLSHHVAERLHRGPNRSLYWTTNVRSVGDMPTENGVPQPLFNLCTKRAGNSTVPVRLREEWKAQVRAHVLFMDIVDFTLLEAKQTAVLSELNRIVRETADYRGAVRNDALICCPSGDGMALVFFNELLAPLRCAGAIALAIKDHPHLKLRMGIHTGYVDRIANLKAQDTQRINDVNGEGIITARRVMDCGDAGHILLSEAAARSLLHLPFWMHSLRLLGVCKVKHGHTVKLYNFCTKDFGNPRPPKQLRDQPLEAHVPRSVPSPRHEPGDIAAPRSALDLLLQCLFLMTVAAVVGMVWKYHLLDSFAPPQSTASQHEKAPKDDNPASGGYSLSDKNDSMQPTATSKKPRGTKKERGSTITSNTDNPKLSQKDDNETLLPADAPNTTKNPEHKALPPKDNNYSDIKMTEAKGHIETARRLEEQGKYDDALNELKIVLTTEYTSDDHYDQVCEEARDLKEKIEEEKKAESAP